MVFALVHLDDCDYGRSQMGLKTSWSSRHRIVCLKNITIVLRLSNDSRLWTSVVNSAKYLDN